MRVCVAIFLLACGAPEASTNAPDASCSPSTLAFAPATDILIDGADVYWLDRATDPPMLMRSAHDGGSAVMIAPAVDSLPALDANNIYLSVPDLSTTRNLYAFPRTGGAPVTLALVTFASTRLVVDDTTLYLAAGGVASVPKTGGMVSSVADGTLIGIDDANVYTLSSADNTTTISVTPKLGGTTRALARVLSSTSNASAMDAENLYLSVDQQLVSVSKANGSVTTLVADLGTYGGFNIATTSGFVYVDQQAMGQEPAVILEVPTIGGAARVTGASGSMGIAGLAVDASTIFWSVVVESSGSLMSVCR